MEGFRKEDLEKKRDAGQEGCRIGRMLEWRDSGKEIWRKREGCRTS